MKPPSETEAYRALQALIESLPLPPGVRIVDFDGIRLRRHPYRASCMVEFAYRPEDAVE